MLLPTHRHPTKHAYPPTCEHTLICRCIKFTDVTHLRAPNKTHLPTRTTARTSNSLVLLMSPTHRHQNKTRLPTHTCRHTQSPDRMAMLSVLSAMGPWPWPKLMTCSRLPTTRSMPSPNLASVFVCVCVCVCVCACVCLCVRVFEIEAIHGLD